jgi:hypothetical protein
MYNESVNRISDLTIDKPAIWKHIISAMDEITFKGIYNSPDFGRKEREYLYALASKNNGCTHCFRKHSNFALHLGIDPDTFNPNIVNCLEEIIQGNTNVDDKILATKYLLPADLIKQIKYSIGIAGFINTMVKNNMIPFTEEIHLKDVHYYEKGFYELYKKDDWV